MRLLAVVLTFLAAARCYGTSTTDEGPSTDPSGGEIVHWESAVELAGGSGGAKEAMEAGKQQFEKLIQRIRPGDTTEAQSKTGECFNQFVARMRTVDCKNMSWNTRHLLTFRALHCFNLDDRHRQNLMRQECWDANLQEGKDKAALITRCRTQLDNLDKSNFLQMEGQIQNMCYFLAHKNYQRELAENLQGMSFALDYSARFLQHMHETSRQQYDEFQQHHQRTLEAGMAREEQLRRHHEEREQKIMASNEKRDEKIMEGMEAFASRQGQNLGQLNDKMDNIIGKTDSVLMSFDKVLHVMSRGSYFLYVALFFLALLPIHYYNPRFIIWWAVYALILEPMNNFYYTHYAATRIPTDDRTGDPAEYFVYLISPYAHPGTFTGVVRCVFIAIAAVYFVLDHLHKRQQRAHEAAEQRRVVREAMDEREDWWDPPASPDEVSSFTKPMRDDIAGHSGHFLRVEGNKWVMVDKDNRKVWENPLPCEPEPIVAAKSTKQTAPTVSTVRTTRAMAGAGKEVEGGLGMGMGLVVVAPKDPCVAAQTVITSEDKAQQKGGKGGAKLSSAPAHLKKSA
ncbi:unnamed protein product [Vitrella brassicaformis CCMP3155]|uniref:t-SNARE coiled-coil homology domain-containing protein n=2 Tax=Vitrella brassicaformis TaxID=1169539 RepID=A0A0G4EM45_VITBC|nr:unnamed protein product [Vitrella brassicaformis CCMP3155]|eukprot:CEL98034.1 unnamed protein product [Vitrella brassicaformis CCMP3155]